MALTDTQKLQAKKHLGFWPNDTQLNASIKALEDSGAKETELTAAIAECETWYANIETVSGNADEIIEGAGAKFSYERSLAIKKRQYQSARIDLARILGVDLEINQDGWYQS